MYNSKQSVQSFGFQASVPVVFVLSFSMSCLFGLCVFGLSAITQISVLTPVLTLDLCINTQLYSFVVKIPEIFDAEG